MDTYTATNTGISITGQQELSWADLADALGTVMSPFSSAAAIRTDLSAALAAGEVLGREDLLREVLFETAPRFVSPPDFTNEEIAAVRGREE